MQAVTFSSRVHRPYAVTLAVLSVLFVIFSVFSIDGRPYPDGSNVAKAFEASRACARLFSNGDHAGSRAGRSEICFRGEIDVSSAAEFMSTPASRGEMLVVSSYGGDVAAAIRMATRIHDLGLQIVIPSWCASSCANYLFVSGSSKFVLPGGIVAFHGSPSLGDPIYFSGPKLTKNSLASLLLKRRELVATLQRSQERLYQEIGVSDRLLYEKPDRLPAYRASFRLLAWCWSKQALQARFHVNGIALYATPRDFPLVRRLQLFLSAVSCRSLDADSWVCRA